MQEKLEQIKPGSEYAGQNCIVCHQPLQVGDEIVACPRCHSLHHVSCWKDKGGCGKSGCPQLAKAIRGEKPKGDGPPPPIPKKYIAGGLLLFLGLLAAIIFWPKPPDPAVGRHKIKIMSEAPLELGTIITDLVWQFNQDNADIYLDLELVPAGVMDTKLMIVIAAGDAPDIFTLSPERFPYFLEEGSLLALGTGANGETIYGREHPAQLSWFVIWGKTPQPQAALEALHYLLAGIPEGEREALGPAWGF